MLAGERTIRRGRPPIGGQDRDGASYRYSAPYTLSRFAGLPLKGKREIWREKQGVIYFMYHSGAFPLWCLTAPPFPRSSVGRQKESALMGRLGALLRPTWRSYAGPPQWHYKAPLCCERLMKGMFRGVLFFPLYRGKSGAARIGGGERSEPVSRIVFMPDDTESKSRNVLASPLGEEGHEVAKGWTVVRMIMTLDVDVTAERRHYNTHRPRGRYHNPRPEGPSNLRTLRP